MPEESNDCNCDCNDWGCALVLCVLIVFCFASCGLHRYFNHVEKVELIKHGTEAK